MDRGQGWRRARLSVVLSKGKGALGPAARSRAERSSWSVVALGSAKTRSHSGAHWWDRGLTGIVW